MINAQNDLAFVKLFGLLIATIAIAYIVYTVYSTLKDFTNFSTNVFTKIKDTANQILKDTGDYVERKIESANEVLAGDGSTANPPLISATTTMQTEDGYPYITPLIL